VPLDDSADKVIKIALEVNSVLGDWVETNYVKKEPLAGMAVSRFKNYRSSVKKDIETNVELQSKLIEKIGGLVGK